MKKFIVHFIILLFLNSSFLILNSEAQWVLQYSDTSFNLIDIKFTSDNTGWAVGYKGYSSLNSTGRLLKTTNGGNNWILQNTGTLPGIWGVNFIDINTGWIVGDRGLVRKTTNGGLNWIPQFIDTTQNAERVYFLNSNTGWITGEYLYKTSNGGDNWVKDINAPFASKAIYFLNSNTGFLTSYYCRIHKTTNAGLNWNWKYSGSQHTFLYDIFFLNDNTGWTADESDGVIRTTNAGENWNRIYQISGAYCIFFKNANTGWIGGSIPYYIMRTTNGGLNYVSQYLSLELYNIWKITKSNDSSIYAIGMPASIFKTTNGGVGINQISTEISSSFSLSQNYPNPFNPVTKIRFDVASTPLIPLRRGTLVVLKVYDVMGREVRTLVNERLQPGMYEVSFDGSALTSGVYFYKIQSGDFVQTNRMVLIK